MGEQILGKSAKLLRQALGTERKKQTRPFEPFPSERGQRDDPVVLHALADCSVAVLLFNAATENLGIAHVPRPIEPGDLLALAYGPALRVTALVRLPGDGVIEALAEVAPA
jgi:hypothetical protein